MDQQTGGVSGDAAATLIQGPMQHNLVAGAIAGLVAALAGAAVWAAVTAATEYQIGWMAIGVGFLVGFAIRLVGKGSTPVFGVVGAALSLLGCVLGNLLTACWFIAQEEGTSFTAYLATLDADLVQRIMSATFDPMDLLFYGFAVWFGFKYSVVPPAQPAAA